MGIWPKTILFCPAVFQNWRWLHCFPSGYYSVADGDGGGSDDTDDDDVDGDGGSCSVGDELLVVSLILYPKLNWITMVGFFVLSSKRS